LVFLPTELATSRVAQLASLGRKGEGTDMKVSFYMAVLLGVMAIGATDTANATASGPVAHTAASNLVIQVDEHHHRHHHCEWRNHRRHCWWD
jgi:hypothetical protein